jgi:uncharacterized protein (DUF2147 family)
MMLMLAAALLATAGPDAVIGTWRTETRNGIVEIQRCGASLCGKLLSSDGIKAEPNLTDVKNKDVALRRRPLRGLQILSGFARGETNWDGGKIYNADDGKTYGARLTPEGRDTLKVRGCVFVPLCKTQTWTRVR